MNPNAKKSTKEWIAKAVTVHGNTYNYSKVKYEGAHSKVKIICSKHGEFLQTAADHTNTGKGCATCGNIKKGVSKNIDARNQFIIKSNTVHNFKYDYTNTKYKTSKDTLKIMCPSHGGFMQLPTNHLSGKGCPKCADESTSKILRLTNDQFIEKAKNVHGEKYNYHLVQYINSHTKIKIICLIHGEFAQTSMSHIAGSGCPTCGVGGFKPHLKSFIYILTDENNTIMKIGITNDLKVRLYSLKHYTPFKFKILHHLNVAGSMARRIEKSAHKMGRSCNFKNFQGYTEWFEYDDKIINYVINEVAV